MHYRKCRHLTECHSQGYCLPTACCASIWCWPISERQSATIGAMQAAIQAAFRTIRADLGDIKGSVEQMIHRTLLFSNNDFLSYAAECNHQLQSSRINLSFNEVNCISEVLAYSSATSPTSQLRLEIDKPCSIRTGCSIRQPHFDGCFSVGWHLISVQHLCSESSPWQINGNQHYQ